MNRKVSKIVLLVASIVAFVAILVLLTLASPDEKSNDFSNQSASNSNSEKDIDGYEYAEFNKFNSYASQNGLANTPVYIKGKVQDVWDFDNECGITLKSEGNGEWLIIFQEVKYSTEIFELLNNQEVLCFGKYIDFAEHFSMPGVFADKLEIDKKTYSLSKLKAISEESLSYNESEEKTELLTEPPTEAPTEQTYPVIFTSDEIEISYFDVKESKYEDDELEVYFLVNNKTDRALEFQADTVILNGISYNDIVMSDPISPGTKGTICAQVEDMMIIPEAIISVGGELEYFDSKTYENTVNISILETQI